MLFNSYTFILLFLPATIFGCLTLQSFYPYKKEFKIIWLICCSLFFYGWWNPIYLTFLIMSLAFNYYMATRISQQATQNPKPWLVLGIALNLALLGYFKYANFVCSILNNTHLFNIQINKIILPLAISFVTFQQIAFLVDGFRKNQPALKFTEYVLFITFFPQLIAGPIVYFSKIIPQYSKKLCLNVTLNSFTTGLSIFILGLGKKVLIADSFQPFSDALFTTAMLEHTSISLIEAWGGALCYAFQLYFDFSGYSDMAIGLAKIFNVKLPINFNSPYKASNLIDFWHRWHITLSDFLRNYLYIPLGGNRKGSLRKYGNLIITMLLGGLWHGAGYNFIIWGALHGFGLAINHAFKEILVKLKLSWLHSTFLYRKVSFVITFSFVVVAWVFFRAENTISAQKIVHAMFDLNALSIPEHYIQFLNKFGVSLSWLTYQTAPLPLFKGTYELSALFIGIALSWVIPNRQEIFQRNNTSMQIVKWKPSAQWSFGLALITIVCLLQLNKISSFLYYQF